LKRAALALLAFGGCSLGLDESKLGAQCDGGAPPNADAAPPDATPPAVAGRDAPPAADAGPCTKDGDCLASDACLSGRCDTSSGACVFDVCKQSTPCTRATCDANGGSCGTPSPYGFHAGSFKVSFGAVGCGGNAGRCFAAAYPYLFVGTTNGLVAYTAADPTTATPPPIPIAGLPFAPSFVVASGQRVWLVGGTFGAGPTYRLQLAWIDVPANPFATTLHAQSVLADTTQASLSFVFPRPGGGVFLVEGDQAKAFPTAIAAAPFADLAALSVSQNAGITSGATPAAASGARLVAYRWLSANSEFDGVFSFIDGAGTKSVTVGADQDTVGAMGKVYGGGSIAETTGGGLAWGAPLGTPNPAGGYATIAARVAFLVDDAQDGTFDASLHADLETYALGDVGFGQEVVGPIASIDPSHVLGLAQTPANLMETSVQIVERAPGPDGGLAARVVAGRRTVLPISSDKLAAASTNGFGYVLANDASDSATVHVFAPACP
jgi:hypothetical protein